MQKILIIYVLLSVIIPSIFFLSFIAYQLLFPWIYSKKLHYIDSQKYQLALYLSKNPQFTKGKVEFRVYNHSYRQDDIAFIHILNSRVIFISSSYLNDPYLDVIIAHELGHIENGMGDWILTDRTEMINEVKADFFSVKICGINRVLDASNYHGFPEFRRNMIIQMRCLLDIRPEF